jgi:glycosyltransferase involved in cell wall biosynthesis
MNVLVVSHSCATAANQRLFARMASATGWDVTLIVPAHWRDEFGNALDQEPVPGLAVKKIPVLPNGNIILHGYLTRWRRFLERGAFDIVHVQHEPYAIATSQIFLAAKRLPVPPTLGFYSCQNLLKRYPFPFSRMEQFVLRLAAYALPITAAVGDVLREKGFAGKIGVCPLPVDMEVYHPRPAAESADVIPRRDGEVVVGYVGRLVEAKGLMTLAEALVRIADLPWRFVAVGTGPLRGRLEEFFERGGCGGRVVFEGYVDHDRTPRYLSAMDVLVLPSETRPNWKEQFGRVIPEALACGTCVVGSDSGEIPVLVTSSGGGVIFPEGNAEALADALRAVIRDAPERAVMAGRGRQWVENNLGLGAVAGRMAATLSEARGAAS